MRWRVDFTIIFILLVFPANCWPKDGHLDSTTQTTSNSTCAPGRCLPKCCGANEVLQVSTRSCLPHDNRLENWSSQFGNFGIIYNRRCTGKSKLVNGSSSIREYEIFANDSIRALKYHRYCLDLLADDGSVGLLLCRKAVRADSADDSADKLFFLRFTIGLSTSIVFLTITLVLYLATPRLHQKVHDKCFLCHVVTLIVGFGWLIRIQNVREPTRACIFYDHMVQFWMLASFFWLNIMCIDIRYSVDNVQIIKESDKRKLLLYCLYAWGCPCLISLFSLCADNFLPPDHFLRTGFGEECCWFGHNKGNFSWVDPVYVHFYIFIVITILINLYMFVDTALIIRTQNKRWEKNENGESKRHKPDDVRIILYLKLFIVMGLYWIVDVLSYHYGDRSLVWTTLDVLNTLQGVFIFIIFICNKRALNILYERFFPRQAFMKQYTKTLSNQNRSMQPGGI